MTFLSLTLSILLSEMPISDPAVRDALKLFVNDPSIQDIQEAALEHFKVATDDLTGYRAAARLKALMPSFTGSYTQDDSRLTDLSSDRNQSYIWDPNNPQVTKKTSGVGRAFSASATWNLTSLIFDSNQLEAYALVGIHEDVLTEVTRLYYTRQHNLLAISLDPPKDPRAKVALLLRTREIEAMLDAMTGGEWSRLQKVKK